jgi:DNA-binding CsgD family transcriptional regulator
MSTGIDYDLSPSVRRYPTATTEEARRCLLDNIQRRLRIEGSPVVVKRVAGKPLLAYLLVDNASARDNREVLKLIDLGETPVPSESWLRSIFNLSLAEARLAQALARGETLEEVACSLGIKISTARTQLAVIFAKTETRRQARLVAILSRLAHVELLFLKPADLPVDSTPRAGQETAARLAG